MLAQREHDYFAETVICANCYIVALFMSTRLECSSTDSVCGNTDLESANAQIDCGCSRL